jgi:glycosyltransferase involved in cell wall biosynthesis
MQPSNKNTRVAVIIPCFNHAEYLEQAINSVVEQEYLHKTIYFSDEQSTDDSWLKAVHMLDNYSPDMDNTLVATGTIRGVPAVLSKSTEPKGPSAARNRLIKIAWENHDVFMMLDADDYYLPGKIGKSVAKFDDDTDNLIGIVYSDVIIYRHHSGLRIREYREPFSRVSLQQECIISNAPLVSKDALTKAGLYDESMRTAEDWDLWLRITHTHVAIHIPEALQVYRVTGKNASDVVPQSVWVENWQKIGARVNAGH